jgi:hypothetical protein
MPPEADVIDPPTKTDVTPPPAATKPGDKFRAAMPKEKGGSAADVTPPPPKTGDDKGGKKEATPPVDDKAKKVSPLDIALGEVKPDDKKATPTDDKKDTAAILKELGFDEKHANYPKFRDLLDERKNEVETLSTELRTVKEQLGKVDPKLADTVSTVSRERDDLKSENARLREAITAINVEFDPDYQAKYVAGRQKLVDRAVSRVKEYGGNVDQFTDALSLNGKARTQALKEALAEVEEIDRPRIISVLDQIQSLDDEKADLQKDPGEAFEKLNARRLEEAERAAQDFERARKSEFDKIVSSLPEKSPMFRQIDGHDDWNEPIKQSIATAEKVLGKDPEYSQVVEIALKGSRYDAVEKLLIDTRKELTAANARIAEFEGASPNLGGSHRKPTDSDDKRTPAQKFHDEMAKTRGGDGDV